MNISQIDKKIEELTKKKQELLDKEKSKNTIIIKELKIEVETNLHKEMNRISKLKIQNGWRLLELSELIFIYNNYQGQFDWGEDEFFDEIVKQPIKNRKVLKEVAIN